MNHIPNHIVNSIPVQAFNMIGGKTHCNDVWANIFVQLRNNK